jgi:hypothetical protein
VFAILFFSSASFAGGTGMGNGGDSINKGGNGADMYRGTALTTIWEGVTGRTEVFEISGSVAAQQFSDLALENPIVTTMDANHTKVQIVRSAFAKCTRSNPIPGVAKGRSDVFRDYTCQFVLDRHTGQSLEWPSSD